MTLLTEGLITEIADALEALGEEFETRNWNPSLAQSVVTAAAGSLVSVAAMRSPVPQQLYPPPPYGYGPG